MLIQQHAQTLSYGLQTQTGVGLALGTAEMGTEDHARSVGTDPVQSNPERSPPRASTAGDTSLRPLLTVSELAETLRTSEKTIRRMVAARRIPCVRIGRQIRFVPGDVLRMLEAQKEG